MTFQVWFVGPAGPGKGTPELHSLDSCPDTFHTILRRDEGFYLAYYMSTTEHGNRRRGITFGLLGPLIPGIGTLHSLGSSPGTFHTTLQRDEGFYSNEEVRRQFWFVRSAGPGIGTLHSLDSSLDTVHISHDLMIR